MNSSHTSIIGIPSYIKHLRERNSSRIGKDKRSVCMRTFTSNVRKCNYFSHYIIPGTRALHAAEMFYVLFTHYRQNSIDRSRNRNVLFDSVTECQALWK
ncbi:hypothetical protein TNIN_495201 [Trichonephila inaurata madagascariensis]|uniref:Uncharacterized protein n=1 Tax=Trichonephila inaurata madagascariensis TaxID=2747483 RepID=A0A8X6X8A5_9ARAC|nr:hypothetical protein TNIN_495201 [Trichonephila inaurata madagascariensis]